MVIKIVMVSWFLMALAAKYGHTNLIARDWRSLASFYERVFGCTPAPPERDLSGEAIERGSRVAGAALKGVHLRLPGYGPDGPTLEIFTYNIVTTPAGNRTVTWTYVRDPEGNLVELQAWSA